jgi:hypothetical protein
MSDLVSKVLAGGLSAAIFLLWWPSHVPADGPEWLAVRGLLWSLAFEILLFSFCPLERAIAATVRDRRAGAIAPRPFARALALAFAGLAIPAALIGGTRGHLGAPVRAAAATPPKVIVKREVVRREVVVKRVNHVVRVPVASARAAGAGVTAAAPVRTTRAAATKPKAIPSTSSSPSRAVATTPERATGTTPAAKAKAKTTTATAAEPAATAPAATGPAAAGAAPATSAAASATTASGATATGPAPGN